MRKTIFRQYKGAWADLPFPSGDTVSGSGCGLCSVTHILIEADKYKNCTPTDFRGYMVKWAVKGAGLIHDGIPDSLKHYGMKNVKEFGYSATMKQIFAECDKGARKGVILFGANKGPDGTVWTIGGHFIAFLKYKKDDQGKHWFYLKDSGGRNHDGWYCYEKSMKGDVLKVWTCTVPKKRSYKPSGPYNGKLPAKTVQKGDKGADVKRLQTFLNWYLGTKFSKGIFGDQTEEAVKTFQAKSGLEEDGIFGPLSKKKAQAIIKKYDKSEKSPYYDESTIIGHACCNEKGGLHGGKPGDQTGHEVQTSYWSKGYGWLKVYRHKDPATRLKIAQYAIDACDNENIGYNVDMPNRYAAWDAAEKNGHNIAGIRTKGDTTCTQLVSMVLRAVGTPKKYAPRHCDVAVATRVLPKNPDLIEYKTKAYTASPDLLEPGDMLLSDEHMAIVVKGPNVPEVKK